MTTAIDLAIHEQVCEERYNGILRRLESLEKKVDDLHTMIDTTKGDIYKLLIGSAVSIIVCLITASLTIMVHLR